jgi:hypothetical protein
MGDRDAFVVLTIIYSLYAYIFLRMALFVKKTNGYMRQKSSKKKKEKKMSTMLSFSQNRGYLRSTPYILCTYMYTL